MTKANMFSPLMAATKETQGQYGTCTKCKRNTAKDERGLCKICDYVARYDAPHVATEQVGEAFRQIRQSDGVIRWPYAALDGMAGPVPLGQVVYVVAGTGIGKTTLAVDMVRRWVTGEQMAHTVNASQRVNAKLGVTVLPLETSPHDWRMALAANMAGVPHGDVFDMVARFHDGDASVKPTLDLIEKCMALQLTDKDLMMHLEVIDDETVTVETLGRAFAIARSKGHKVVLIDHIDQVGDEVNPLTGRQLRGLDAVEKVNNAVLLYARMYKMVAVCMSQVNSSVQGDGSNPLLRYRKLELKHVMFNAYKNKNAAQILGVFRPIRPDITRHDFALVREGVIEPMEALSPGRMGINAMKLRHRGQNEGRTVDLAYEHGRVRDLTAQELNEDYVKRLHGEALSHSTIVDRPRNRKNDGDGAVKTSPKPAPPQPAPSYYEKDPPPALDM